MTLFQRAGKAAGGVIKSLGATLGSMAAMWAIGEVLQLVITGVDHLVNSAKYAKEALDDFNDTVKEQQSSLSSQKDWIDKNGEQYEKLANGVDKYGHNVSLTSDEFSEYKNLTKEIADMFPSMIQGYNDQNEAILKNKGSLKELTKAYKDNQDGYYAKIRTKSGDTFDDFKKATKGDVSKKNQLSELINNNINQDTMELLLNDYGMFYNTFGETLGNKLTTELYDDLNDKFKHNANHYNGQYFDAIDFSKLTPKLQQSIRDAYSQINQTIDTESEKVRPILQAYLYGQTSGYSQLDDEAKEAVQSFIQNVDSSFFDKFDSDTDMESWIATNVINPLKDGIDNADLAVRIQTLFSLSEEDYDSYSDYVKAVLDIISSLSKMTDKKGNKIYTKQQINNLKTQFGVGDVDSDGNVSGQKKIDNAAKRFDGIKGADKYIRGLNKDQLDTVLYKLEPDKVKSLKDLKDFVKNDVTSEAQKATNLSFKEAWKELNNPTSDTLKNTKKDLLELANTGTLTKKTFSKVTGASDFLSSMGLSDKNIDSVISKINALIEDTKQLSAMRTGITAITSAYDEKKESKKNVVSSATLGSLSDTLGVSDWSKSDKKVWENYKKTAGDGKKSLSELKKAQDDLATSYVNSNNFLSNLDETNKGYYISLLQEMGVTNATEVVNNKLKNSVEALNLQKGIEEQTGKNLLDLTYDQVEATSAYNAASQDAKIALNNLYLKEKIFQNNDLSLDGKVRELRKYAEAIGETVLAEDAYKASTKAAGDALANGGNSIDAHKASTKAYINYMKKHLLKTKTKTDVKTSKGNNSNNNKNSSNSKSNSQSKSSTQQIDWIARAIDVLNNKLDLANAKYNNLTSLKGKKNNLAEQIKYTTKLINAEKVALSKYTAQYKAVKLDGKLKTAVKEGRLRGTRKQLIATYGEKTANKIQKYQDLYDKAQTARTAIQTQRKNRTDKRKERLQLDVDDADARSSLADARIENNTSAKAKNVQEEKKYKSTKKSYDYQIKIAKLEKDNVKVATLRAQKEKALLDIRVQEKQNLADENEATYNLNQQLETNAVGYKNKNLYETRSRESLKSQYSYLIEIAKLQGNITEQKRLETELQEKTQSSYMQEINNIKDDYNNRTSLNESDISTNQSKIEKLQAEGLRVSSDFYATNMAINANKRQTLVEEISQLQSHMNTLTPYSSDWYSTVQDINTIAQNIDTCDKNTVEWQQAINDLELSKFQLINSQLESTINHLDFLIDMIDEDDMFGKDSGNITDAGITALSLYIDKMNETSESIKNKRAEWSKFQEQVARGTSGYDEKTIQEKNEEYASSLRNLIKTNKEVEDSITSIVENGLNKQKDALDDIISKYKQALDRASELRDYQKDVADQTKNINSIEKRIKALSGNDLSEEARARIQKLTVELNDAKDNLQDTQYARWKTDQENMLDDLSDSFEQSITDALANTDSIIEAVQMLVADNGSTIKAYLENMGFGGDSNIVGTKYASNGAYNSTFSTYDGNYVRYNYDMNGNLLSVDTLDSSGNMISSLQNTNSSTNGSNSTSTSTVPTNTATAPTVSNASSGSSSGNNYSALQMKIDKFLNSSLKDDKKSAGADQRLSHDHLFKYLYEKYHHKTISKENEAKLGKLLGIKTKSSKKITDEESKKILKALKNAGYANGGVVSGLKGAIRANGDSLIATVNPRESILTEEFTNMLPKAVDIMSNFNTLPSLIPKSILNNRSVSQDIKIGDINVTVDAPNAYDANGITQAIKQSTALQKTLQDATVGQVSKSFNNKLSI